MIFRVFQGFAAVAAFVLLTGFGAGAPIRDVVSAPIPPNPAATLDGVQKAILRAYRTSTNLDFDASKRTIHSNYNGWIGNLDKAIRAQVTVL
jgi:hypothetical protein